ncbi:MAG: U32 family peptidase [Oscillospiraceae bacterium]|nr:U32 family peptidase [Oscillospiraceae bacterium]
MTELLSPAGDFDCLRAAVRSGADAVYVGGKDFSARKGAKNFSAEELSEAAAYCHERGVKLYIAINTLVKSCELSAAEDAVKTAARSGVDGLIIQDLAVMEVAGRLCPELPIHASTQLTAHSAEDVAALMEMGFSRVVLSRELSEAEISRIYSETGCEIEAFVHGALCVCFSGRCLMSSFIGGRSGNRGCCAQPCRQLYGAEGGKGYFLSPRDLSLAHRIDAMKKAGVCSFKIEGRMKSPEYVAVVTSVYRKAIDGLPLSRQDEEDLRSIFSRGGEFTEAYFSGINTPEMMNYNISNDNISRAAPKELITRAQSLYNKERQSVGVSMELRCREGENISLTVSDGKHSVQAEGPQPQRAENAPLTAEKAEERLSKTGGTPYYVAEFKANIGACLFLPAAELNALRRECFEQLGELRRQPPERKINGFKFEFKEKSAPQKQRLFAEITFPEQLEAAKNADKVIVPLALFDKIEFKENYAAILPQIILDRDTVKQRLSRLPKGAEVYSSSLGGLRLIAEAGLTPVGDYGLNVFNPVSAEILAEEASRLTLSPELNLKEIIEIGAKASVPLEILAYGRQRVMVSRACIVRGVRGRCDCASPLTLRDKTGAEFTVLGDRGTHLNTVLNSRPTFMADKLSQLRRTGADLRLCFTTETADEISDIVQKYRTGGEPEGEFTRGYYFK